MLSNKPNLFYLPYHAAPLDQIVAWHTGQAITNLELQTRIYTWQQLLIRTPGDLFALYINNSFEFACALFGGWLAGKTFYLPGNVLPATCAALQNKVAGFLGDFANEWSPLIPAAADAANFNPANINHNCLQDFIALIIYTSGTTGEAQAIPKRLAQLAAEIITLGNLFSERLGTAEIIATVPHEHIYGLLFKILWPLAAGRIIHLQNVVFLEELMPTITTRDCVLITTPAHLKRFTESPAAINNTNHLRAIFSSGALLPTEVAQQTGKLLGTMPIEIYGSSETGGIAWRQRQLNIFTETNESWQTLSSVAWRVAMDEPLLEIRSAHLPDNEWFRTADRVIAISDNNFILQGRCDRIVKLEGKRISLDAIERALAASPLVAVVRVLMLEKRQRIAAFIVLTNAGQNLLTNIGKLKLNQQLRDNLLNCIEHIALPRTWRYIDKMPVNAQGKTTPAELIALLETNTMLPLSHLIEQDNQRVILALTIPRDLIYFNGHFPAAPILPGVVQVDWAIHYGKQYFNLPPFFRAIHTLKFQNVILPGAIVKLELTYDMIKSALTFRLYSTSGQHASGKILFSDTELEQAA